MRKFFILFCLLSCSFLYSQTTKSSCGLPTSCETNPSLHRGDAALESLTLGSKTPAGYGHPGNIHVNDPGDVFFTGSYLYWCIREEGLNLATTAYVLSANPNSIEPSVTGGFALFQKTNYTQGFKVGVGANLTSDDWVFEAEGTRICQTTHTNSKPAPTTTAGTGVFKPSGWFYETIVTQDVVANQIRSKWEFELDWIDVGFKRPYYQGKRLVATPMTGLRASRIWQKLNITALNAFQAYSPSTAVTDVSKNYSHSWAIGPRALLDLKWLFGAGFRMQGNIGASILFTQFSKISHTETGTVSPSQFSMKHYNCLRPMAEASLGLGWGTYLCYSKRHLDVSVTYDFNYLWSQNMLRYIAEINSTGNGSQSGDLQLYGLTIKGRSDF